MNTAADIYYTPADVMQIMNYSKSKAYKVIADLNHELEERGYLTRRGMVPKRYFNDRFAFTAPAENPGPTRPRPAKSSTKEEKKCTATTRPSARLWR